MHGLSDREKNIAAAAFLRGLAVGLAVRATNRWHLRVRGSKLAETKVFPTVAEIMTDGRASNALLIYELRDLAESLGMFQPHHRSCELVSEALRKPEKRNP